VPATLLAVLILVAYAAALLFVAQDLSTLLERRLEHEADTEPEAPEQELAA
jgi:hypothetical protein